MELDDLLLGVKAKKTKTKKLTVDDEEQLKSEYSD
jgi:hypothetical protein